jgi:transcriptional regulator with XRE-family HTH domain
MPKRTRGQPYFVFIGGIIQEHRRLSGLTTGQLADLCGVTRSMIIKLESGQTSTSLKVLFTIADACGFSIESLRPEASPELRKTQETASAIRVRAREADRKLQAIAQILLSKT